MKNISILTLVCAFLFVFTMAIQAADKNGLRHIKENYKSILIPLINSQDSLLADFMKIEPETEISDQAVVELHQRYPFDLKKIERYLSMLTDNGFWADINYADTKRSGWEPKIHAERILELAKLYYSPSTSYYHSEKIKKAIHEALHYWFMEKPKCLNWWYNQIGIPKTMGAAFILLEEQLSKEEKEAAVEVMENAKFGMTGQNKVWLAGNVLIKALLKEDRELVKAARDTIASEIVLGRKEGIKNDWSFHQHGPQQQFGNYGLSFISGMSFFYRLFKGTDYEFEKQQMDILTSLINKGYRWVIWNRYMDINSLGRQLFHHAQIHKAYSLAFAAADLGIGGFSAAGNTLVGHKHFDDSDYTVHRSKNWMASVKMASNRVIGTELVNEDNLKGYYMADGATYYYVQGDEYLDVFPFWDWRKIPGITSYEDTDSIPKPRGERSRNKSNLVGGLSNGICGMTSMELRRDGLNAYKSWLFTKDFVLCLGAGIHSDSTLNVTTAIDQRLKKGKLEVWNKNEWKEVRGKEIFCQNHLRFFHDQTGYIVVGNDSCVAQSEKRGGRWCDFMKMYRPATVEDEVVSLHLRHGMQPEKGTYQYIVFPASDKATIEGFDMNNVKVIRNDSIAQIVNVPAIGTGYWVSVYQPVKLMIESSAFTPEIPGIYYIEKVGEKLVVKQEVPFRTSEAK